jgi:hypothetical protein
VVAAAAAGATMGGAMGGDGRSWAELRAELRAGGCWGCLLGIELKSCNEAGALPFDEKRDLVLKGSGGGSAEPDKRAEGGGQLGAGF